TPVMTTTEMQIRELEPWFHNLHFPDGTQTAPNHPLGDFPAFKWRQIAPYLPGNLRGWRVLDIGCNAGFYAFELAKRGASVIGIDVDAKYLRQARWAARRLKLRSRPSFRRGTIYGLGQQSETFDLVVFMGVFYHLRYPLLGLDIAARKARKFLVFQSLTIPDLDVDTKTVDHAESLGGLDKRQELAAPGWPRMAFIEESFAGDPTNWWIPNRAGILSMLRSCGLRITAEPGDEIFLCEPDPGARISPFAEADYRAVIGSGKGLRP
ncbi:MAG TPA: TIGR04290 family methyltransferase, partial [Chthoniobacterales bacterium]|nr:TIGR04290 family methyltransferase [Chthoniobacterales bacterium]